MLTRFGVVERLGLDEFYVDVTPLVTERLAAGFAPIEYSGHVFRAEAGGEGEGEKVAAETSHRPQDLRSATCGAARTPLDVAAATEEEVRLATGSWVAAEARAALRSAHGLAASCGISVNKLISKLCGGEKHKRNERIRYAAKRQAPPSSFSKASQHHTASTLSLSKASFLCAEQKSFFFVYFSMWCVCC